MDKQSCQKFIRKGFSGDLLKTVALVCMFIDHTAVAFKSTPAGTDGSLFFALRAVGRLAFPIYVFLVAQGFLHTRSVVKYAVRLFIAALVSEIPYDMAFYGRPFSLTGQNALFTLFLGLLAMYFVRLVRIKVYKNLYLAEVLMCLVCAFFAGAAWLLKTNYGAAGVVAAVAVMLFAESPVFSAVSACIFTAWTSWLQMCSLFAVVPLMMYSGEKGRIKHRYLFYAAYPLSFIIPGVIRQLWFT